MLYILDINFLPRTYILCAFANFNRYNLYWFWFSDRGKIRDFLLLLTWSLWWRWRCRCVGHKESCFQSHMLWAILWHVHVRKNFCEFSFSAGKETIYIPESRGSQSLWILTPFGSNDPFIGINIGYTTYHIFILQFLTVTKM